MRIASLLPAATEWVAVFGAADQIVARSHECNFPPEVQDVPVVTSSSIDDSASAGEIDSQVKRHLSDGLSLYEVDFDRLSTIQPDLIITQDQCEVCAVSMPQLESLIAQEFADETELLSLKPSTFKEVLDGALKIGKSIDCMPRAMQVVGELERSLQELKEQVDGAVRERGSAPSVVCIEWMDPLMTAGHWTPDCVQHAGGEMLLAETGEPSKYIDWPDVRDANPDVLCVIPCGYSLEKTVSEKETLTSREGWSDLKAVQSGQVYFFDGDSYFNRPGPRLYRSIELLADAFFPKWNFSIDSVEKGERAREGAELAAS